MIARFQLVYNRKNSLNEAGKALVQIEAYLNGSRRYFTTGLYLKPSEWNSKKREPKDSALLPTLRGKISELDNYQRKILTEKGQIALSDFDQCTKTKKEIKPKTSPKTFTEFFQEQLKGRSVKIKLSTYRNQKACLEKFIQFRPIVDFADLNPELLDQFDSFLAKLGSNDSTRNKRHRQLSTYIRLAVQFGYLNRNPYENYTKPRVQSREVVLLEDELLALENLTFTQDEKRLERFRDMFLFSCYTGLRFGDTIRLTTHHFTETKDGLRLYQEAQKTDKQSNLPLFWLFNGRPEQIIRKHWQNDHQERLFKFSSPFANLKVKELARRASIKKHLTYHVSRHTAATIIGQVAGVLVAQSILQHSKLETTQRYFHLAHGDRDKALSNVQKWF